MSTQSIAAGLIQTLDEAGFGILRKADLDHLNETIAYLTEQRNRLQQRVDGQKEALRRQEAALKDRNAEIARHHKDFERWEDMADRACARAARAEGEAALWKQTYEERAEIMDTTLAVLCST
jgi:chromosome segregation ATPase